MVPCFCTFFPIPDNSKDGISATQSHFFFSIKLKISSLTKKTFHFSSFLFCSVFRCVNLTFPKAISICTADASNLKQEAAAQVFNSSFWVMKKYGIVVFNIFLFLKKYLKICCVSSFSSLQTFQLQYQNQIFMSKEEN